MEKLKKIVAKFLTFESKLGEHIFLNVPVLVEPDVDPKTFDPENDDYSLSAEIIDDMSRLLAKKWLIEYQRIDQDGNHIRRYQLSAKEVYGIMIVCGLKAADLADIFRMSPAQISKVLNEADGQKLRPIAVRFLLNVLKGELTEMGFAAKVLDHKELCVRQTENDFDLRRA